MGPQGKKAPAPVPTIPLPDLKHCIQLRRNEARDGRQLHMGLRGRRPEDGGEAKCLHTLTWGGGQGASLLRDISRSLQSCFG